MFQVNSQNKNQINFLNILISLIPLTLILGNLATNINIIFIIVTGTILFGKEIFLVKKKIYAFLIYSFFFFLIINTFFNNLLYFEETKHQEHIIKSLFYLRFLFLFLIINKLLETKKFNINIFFYSCAFFSFLISVDIIIQFIFKSNLIGYKIISNKPSSFFGEELIAGGYLQRFSLFLIFFIFLKYMPKKNQNLFLIFLFIIFLIPIVLTGNRMPTLVMILSFFLYYLIQKKIKEILIILTLIVVSVPLLDKLYDQKKFNVDLNDFFVNSYSILINTPKLFFFVNIKASEFLTKFISVI